MAVLITFLRVVLLILATAMNSGAHTGRVIPLCCDEDQKTVFVANIVSAYFTEQMGRYVRVVQVQEKGQCLDEMEAERAPISVVAGRNAVDSVVYVTVGPALTSSIGSYSILMGRKAKDLLIFSLVPQYIDRLSGAFGSLPLQEALERVRSGQGPRKVALDILRNADLI